MKHSLILFTCLSSLLAIAYGVTKHGRLRFDGIDEYQVAPTGGSRSYSETITVRWGSCVKVVNICQITCKNVIGRIEEMILAIPLRIIRATTLFPLTIARAASVLVKKALRIVVKAKLMLEEFFIGVFEAQARALYGTMSIVHDLIIKIETWCSSCIGSQGSKCDELPHLGGFGPCGGKWPCTETCVCKTTQCVTTTAQIAAREMKGTETPQKVQGQRI